MPWWGWMILGLFLLGSELLIVDAAFFLVFIGAASLVTGAVVFLGVMPELWMQWLLFSALAIVAMVFFRKRLYDRLRSSEHEFQDGLTGEVLRLEHDLLPGESCRQSYRGTDWNIVNRGTQALSASTEVIVDRTEGLTIIVNGPSPTN